MLVHAPLQAGLPGALPSDPILQLLVGLVVLLIVLYAVRVFLKVAWKLLLLAGLVIAVLYGFSILGAPVPL